MRIRVWCTTLVLILLAAAPLPAAASDPAAEPAVDPAGEGSGWTAWYGCWSAVGTRQLICVIRGEAAAAVRIVTVQDGEPGDETILHADSVPRAIEEGGCRGSETAFFSRDRRRIFTRAELTCGVVERVSTGVLAFVSGDEWLDAQAVSVAGEEAVRTVRYRAVARSRAPAALAARLPDDDRLAREASRIGAAVPLGLAEVVEASRAIMAPAVEALLAARQHGFGLNARALSRLEKQGVPASTIDVMVGLSYPARFAVRERRGGSEPAAGTWRGQRNAWAEDCYDPYWANRRYSRYSDCARNGYGYDPMRDRYGYGYSPWGYDRYGWQHGRDPVVVIVQPQRPEDPGGRVVKGRGYTPGNAATGTAAPRSRSGDSGGARTAAPAASSKPASSEPASSGSSTRRKAKRRGDG